jgi:hypothetical protein
MLGGALGAAAPASGVQFGPIAGENPNFRPNVDATFSLSGSQLTLVLTYTGWDPTGAAMSTIGEALSGILFEADGLTITSVASILLTSGSQFEGANSGLLTGGEDLRGEYALLSGVSTSTPLMDFTNAYALSSVGTVNFAISSGTPILPASKLLMPPSTGGTDFALVPDELNLGAYDATLCPGGACPVPDGFGTQGPMIEDSITVVFNVSGSFDPAAIRWVPQFGSNGAPVTPEPISALLFAIGVGTVGASARAMRRHAA